MVARYLVGSGHNKLLRLAQSTCVTRARFRSYDTELHATLISLFVSEKLRWGTPLGHALEGDQIDLILSINQTSNVFEFNSQRSLTIACKAIHEQRSHCP